MDEVKTDPAQETREAKVKFDFDAASLNELSLKKGEVVTLLREVDDILVRGSHRDRARIFPIALRGVMRADVCPTHNSSSKHVFC
ncbi:PREDICTED: vinexin-like [Priapulus caudatus]|uniref:Vinexin-like n=1 Tax=Priapulus caudatus TaxID=37621 RepID=A0ABM1F2E4_PRICU|nr:PREDICTED: vinexin-like [Priapulus caudatus]